MYRSLCGWAVVLGVSASGCAQQPAYGDANSIIVGTSNEIWDKAEERVVEALEGRVYTVADERTFELTHVDPRETDWTNLQKFKQVLLIGPEDDPWVAYALEKGDGDKAMAGDRIAQVRDVWARNQLVTIALVDAGNEEAQLEAVLPDLAELYDGQFREYVVNRMFLSGADSALADSLYEAAGFRLIVPKVYQWQVMDSVYLFRNDNPDPSELVRQVAVTWKTPIPEDEEPEDLLDWRQEISDQYYVTKQVPNLERVDGGPGGFGGRRAYQIQAAWQSPPDRVPAGGPFILRALLCPEQERMYLLDGWLYAPGKDKYEYMIQLEEILDSFRCADAM